MSKLHFISKKFRKKYLFVLLLTGLLVCSVYYALQVLTIGAAYKTKLLCTNTFFAKREPDRVLREDLDGPERIIFTSIDYTGQSVSAWFPGVTEQQAFYMSGLGCVLSSGIQENELRNRINKWTDTLKINPVEVRRSVFFENFNHPEFDQQKLKTAIDNAFYETDPDALARTRALLILYKDQLITERYAPGITKDMPLQGWSMTKSAINTLVGILVKQGKLSFDQHAPIPEWAGDLRSTITLDHLLRMSSGLEFDETGGAAITDLTDMLFRHRDAAAFAISKPLSHPPDTHWQYSSGTANIISRIVREANGGSTADVVTLLHNELFNPLGFQQAIIEPDASGNLIGSSFMYATARDWVRFGQLYLQDGVWKGKRLLPKGWVQYSSTPTPTSPQGEYGAHFWTNGGIDSVGENRPFPGLPGDLYYAAGYKGQRVVIIPSHELVIVRLGWSDAATPQNMETMVKGILNAKLQ